MQLVLLVGAPGAGKGTQADLLVDKLGFKKLSTGDLLRKHIKEQTQLGKLVSDILASGRLVSDAILFEMIKEELPKSGEKVLLDGYPRTLQQARDLDSLSGLYPVAACVYLDVPESELLDRLTGRRICKGCGKSFHIKFDPPKVDGVCDACGDSLIIRPDDDIEKIKVRLDVFNKETKPIIYFYKDTGLLYTVDGIGSTEEIYKKIEDTIVGLD